ncbi:nitrogen regulatory protein PII [Natronobacillus azotifigens]|uniref:P-II family nitrogen regulator n=1 Tax=Natronobacillus azotifigens TaxID=472978 RepID=A0A9J6RDX9_9BACI|nr:P-II family nitrogen regulator [Natronobacillus azotifigens]MCZ0703759.1 P-II family nitrogen regulator [Natronobacillus azotifigens]
MLNRITDHKLIVTIVKKDKAKKIVHATRLAGAQGGTTLLGKGFRLNEKQRFLGIPIEREREIIFTIVSRDIYYDCLTAIESSAQLNKQKTGIAFVIDIKKVTGISRMLGNAIADCSEEGVEANMNVPAVYYDLIVTIVNNGDSEKVVDATKRAGAEGGTIIHGRGTGIHEKAKLFNILIEPEKEVVLTLIERERTEEVLQAINEDAALNKPGKGIAFVLEVEKTIGINHIYNELLGQKYQD